MVITQSRASEKYSADIRQTKKKWSAVSSAGRPQADRSRPKGGSWEAGRPREAGGFVGGQN